MRPSSVSRSAAGRAARFLVMVTRRLLTRATTRAQVVNACTTRQMFADVKIDSADNSCKPSDVPDWNKVRESCKALAGNEPVECGWLTWGDAILASNGEPPTTRFWREALRDFWRSGKPFFACGAGQRSTKSTSCIKALTLETLLRERTMVLDQTAICGVMSANTAEANDRCATIAALLKGFGLRPKVERGELDATVFASSVAANTGRSTFDFLDANEARVRIAISPPTRDAASGWTGAGALFDELDLWREKDTTRNPAADVLTIAHGRLYDQKGAHGYHVSTPMGKTGPLSTMIREAEKSGAEGLHVARLGEYGARRDGDARAALRAHLRERALRAPTREQRAAAEQWAEDRRLAVEPDPMATAIPTWAARDGDPAAEIAECWRLAGVKLTDGEEGGTPLDVLMARYGARPEDSGRLRLFSAGILAQARALSPSW